MRTPSLSDAQLQQLIKLGHVKPCLSAREIATQMNEPESTIHHWLMMLRRDGRVPAYKRPGGAADGGGVSDYEAAKRLRQAREDADRAFGQILQGRLYRDAPHTPMRFPRIGRPSRAPVGLAASSMAWLQE